jgi:large subunit ribosomal protein L2
MGKRIIAQRRGRGTTTYRAHSFNYKGRSRNKKMSTEQFSGQIVDIIHCRGHSAPLAQIRYEDGEESIMIAPEGISCGDRIAAGPKAGMATGNTVSLDSIPEGTAIFNIEKNPGDGGKFVRSSGAYAKVVAKLENSVVVLLPSKKQKSFNPNCRANIGVVAGGGRTEKPFLKAGNKYYKAKARNKLWPRSSGASMNAVDHPFGTSRSSRKSKARPCPKHAPPGRKVGMIRPRQTGRKRGKRVM